MQFAKKLRAEMTPPEVWLWRRLKLLRSAGVRVRRQHPLGRCILDFNCVEAKVAVEIDGFGHAMGDQPKRDEVRDAWLRGQGVEIIRIQATEAMRNPDEVADWLGRLLAERPPQSASPTAPP